MTEERRTGDFQAWMTKHRVRSTLILATGMWMSIDSYQWAKGFAVSSTLTWEGTVAIIVAVQGIATSFTAWAFNTYSKNKTP